MSPHSERVIAERYRVVKKLGEGGMGAVYLAEHVHMRKLYALKMLLPEAMGSPEIVARFEREAIAAGNISHPNVVAATDFGRLPDGSFFLVLEYVEGKSLRELMLEGPVAPDRALRIVRQILLALGAAHAKGVVHRDMKPENVMLAETADGEVVKVLDFGIAKMTFDVGTAPSSQQPLTRMGAIYGTPAYMAPEQALGHSVDSRVDLYAVGVILYEMIAGAPPFEGEGVVVLAKHVNDAPPKLQSKRAPGAVTTRVRALVERLLAKSADDRHAGAHEVVQAVDAALASIGPGSTSEVAPTVHGSESFIGSAATVHGEMSASPPPVAIAKTEIGHTRVPGSLETRIAPLARKLSIAPRDLLIALGGIAATLFLVVLFFALRSPRDVDDDAPRSGRRHATPTANAAGKSSTADPPTPFAPPPPSAAPSASSSAKPGAGRNFIRKIKGLF